MTGDKNVQIIFGAFSVRSDRACFLESFVIKSENGSYSEPPWFVSSSSEAVKDKESLVECGVRGDPVLEMPHYPGTHTQTDRSTAHAQPPCTHWHTMGIRSSVQTANQIPKYLNPTVIISYKLKITLSHRPRAFRAPLPLLYIKVAAARAADTADIWLCIRCYNNLFLGRPRLLCGVTYYNYCQYPHSHRISQTQPATRDLSHVLGHLHIRGK